MKILVIDDDESVGRMIGRLLRACRHEVVVAPDGESGIAMMNTEAKFDFMFTDLDMGRVDGLEVLRSAREKLPHARRFLMSGRMDAEIEEKAKSLGAKEGFLKPEFGKVFMREGLI